jgi:hypothetical protein
LRKLKLLHTGEVFHPFALRLQASTRRRAVRVDIAALIAEAFVVTVVRRRREIEAAGGTPGVLN